MPGNSKGAITTMSFSLDTLQKVLNQRPLGLAFDIDGTLSAFAPTPDEACLFSGVRELLEQAKSYAHILITTGRDLENAAAMVGVADVTYIGTHGLEWCDDLPSLRPAHIVPEALNYITPGQSLLDLAEYELGSIPGILIERKRVGGAVHYRRCANPEETKQRIREVL